MKGNIKAMKDYHLNLPVSNKEIAQLRAGDMVYLTGKILTLRDRPHQRIHEYVEKGKEFPFSLKECAVIHCGPIIKKLGESEWEAVSIGATSSSRFSPFIPNLIKGLGPRVIIGKGNLFKEAVDALKDNGSVFLLAIGGCAALYGDQVKKVSSVYWKEFGMSDAVWEFDVENFGPLSVGIDTHGNDLNKHLREDVLKERLAQIYHDLDIDPDIDYTWWPRVPAGTKRATDYSTKA